MRVFDLSNLCHPRSIYYSSIFLFTFEQHSNLHTMRFFKSIFLLFSLIVSAQKNNEYKTYFEKGNGNQSANYEETIKKKLNISKKAERGFIQI